tara:strand:- start:11389 stop:12027 length:639 start_codon:yes stop_codon:yes gene_type:complete
MPLLVGIENGPSKGFTDEELDFTNGFRLGSVSSVTGCGDCRDPREFLNRLMLVWPLFNAHYTKDSDGNLVGEMQKLPDFVNLEFVERMKEAGWYTNAASWTTRLQFAISLSWFLIREHKHKFGGPSMEEKNYTKEEKGYGHPDDNPDGVLFLDGAWSPEEHLRGHNRKQRQFEEAVLAISKDRFMVVNPHKAYEKTTIDPKNYDSQGYLIDV